MPLTEIRRRFLHLVAAVVVLDAVAIGLYYATSIARRPERVQQIFVGVWMAVTLAVVLALLMRIRALRRGRR